MDRTDRLILDIMQRDARTSIVDIGTNVGVSTASVQRRLKRLRAEGTIFAEVR